MNLNSEQYFSIVPEADIPRSKFDRSFSHKTTMNVNQFVPIFIDEALPGDTFKLNFQAFGRLTNPLVRPVMDEIYFETLWFKCANRLLWSNWKKFCGEQDNPDDSIDFVIPTINSGSSGFAVGSLADYYGIPTGVPNLSVNALPFRFYNLTYNQWLRDENLINSVVVPMGDSDSASNYTLLKSAKIHDYFTSALPWQQKGDPVTLNLGGTLPVHGNHKPIFLTCANESQIGSQYTGILTYHGNDADFYPGDYSSWPTPNTDIKVGDSTTSGGWATPVNTSIGYSKAWGLHPNGIYSGMVADASMATGFNVSDLRFAIQLQKKREKDARGGTRYIEWVKAHFNVNSPDARQQRVEFLGMTRKMIDINSVVQTSSSDDVTPQGNLTAYGVIGAMESGFTTSFTEHSYVMGLARIRHNPVYQQGLNKMWSRSTLLDFYLPVFSHLSEQPIKNSELYAQGANVRNASGDPVDDDAFGFQEAWAEYRYKPSMITGQLRSTAEQSLDNWHLAQEFSALPVLNQSFIEENIPMDRVLAINSGENIPQFIMDFHFDYECARPMPVRSIPGLVDHF